MLLGSHERVRQALIAYIDQEGGIAVERLWRQMEDAFDAPVGSLSTMKRFIKAEVTPSEEFIAQCRHFLSNRDPEDRIGDLGFHLDRFFSGQPDFAFSTRYGVVPEGYTESISDLFFTRDGPSWIVSERISSVQRVVFEGVAAYCGNGYLCTMREMIVGIAAKTYFIRRVGFGLVGSSSETLHRYSPTTEYGVTHEGLRMFLFRLIPFEPPARAIGRKSDIR